MTVYSVYLSKSPSGIINFSFLMPNPVKFKGIGMNCWGLIGGVSTALNILVQATFSKSTLPALPGATYVVPTESRASGSAVDVTLTTGYPYVELDLQLSGNDLISILTFPLAPAPSSFEGSMQFYFQ